MDQPHALDAGSTRPDLGPLPLLVDVGEAARLLGLGRTKVFELLASGDLESVVVGRRRLVPTAALVEFVTRLRNNGAG